MGLRDLEQPARKLVEAVNLAGRPIPLDVAAALIEASAEDALEVGDRLVTEGLVATAGNAYIRTDAKSTDLTSVHVAYLNRELARAFTAVGYADRDPALVGEYLLKAGDAVLALPLVDTAVTAASEKRAAQEMIPLIDAALAASEAEGLTGALEARLRFERAKYYQLAGWSDRAAADLRSALRHLEGAFRIDALGFLAAVEDDRQESQTAEVYAALGLAEAAAIGEPLKAGSLLLLQARIVQRIGFPSESRVMLSKGTAVLKDGGSAYQRWLAALNTGRITLDRGSAVEAVPLLMRVFSRAEQVAGRAAQADAAAWLARAQFLAGLPMEGLDSVAAARDLAAATDTPGPIFLGHMARAEGAIRFAAHETGLEAADAMLGLVQRQLPDWENAARYLRARALLGLGQPEQARDETERALELSPNGINGWRWRLRIEAFRLIVLAAHGRDWPKRHAEDLTDELLQGQSQDVAAELMAVRARVEGDKELARQAAALALQLGVPTTAALATEAGALWSDPAGAVVASRINEIADHTPADWREAWVQQPEIAAALGVPDVVDEQLSRAASVLQADLDAAMAAAGLTDGAATLSPAQRRASGLVRRRRSRRRASWIAAAAVVALVIAASAVLIFAQASLEETKLTELPEVFTGQWVTFGGGPARAGASGATGVAQPQGYYWRNDDNQGQFFASPVIIGQKVVVGGLDGRVYFMDRRRGDQLALTASTGARIDATATGATIGPTIASSTGVVMAIVPSDDGSLYAFDIADGTKMWTLPIDSCCSPGVDEAADLVYVGGEDRLLHIIDLGGTERSTWPKGVVLDGPVTTDITVADGKAYFGVGSELWQFDLSDEAGRECHAPTGGVFLTPVVSDGIVYAATSDGFIHLLDTEECARFDNIFVSEDLSAKPAVHDGIIYQPGARGVAAYDTSEAVPEDRLLWGPAPVREGAVLAPTVNSSPAVAGGLVYFGANDGFVYALDRDTGELVWEWSEGLPITASVAATDGVVYVATTGGRVIAIGGDPGQAQPVPSTTTTATTAPPSDATPGAG